MLREYGPGVKTALNALSLRLLFVVRGFPLREAPIPMAKRSRDRTARVIRDGLREFTAMPLGLSKAMDAILADFKNRVAKTASDVAS